MDGQVKKYLGFSMLCICMMIFPFRASAHTDNSEGYSKLSMDDSGLVYEIQLDYLELARIVDLGVTTNTTASDLAYALTKNENKLEEYFHSKLAVFNQGAKVEGSLGETGVERKLNRDYANLTFHYPIKNKDSAALQITYDIFFEDNDSAHRNIASYEIGDSKGQFVFTSEKRELHVGEQTIIGQSIPFIKLGFHHILIGLDHILFIIALVVTSKRFIDVIKIMTLFTLAHSVTIGLTALNLLSIPAEIVEPLIALSVAFVAIEKYIGLSEKYRNGVVFLFGLIHGIGFAGALELNTTDWTAIWPIFTFNVGVEMGQALIIALLFPILILIRKYKWSYSVHLATNIAIFFIGLTWYFQRFLA
ncbi:HupE/UreJ family protein [Neobacillus niacini]|uniref:HupE/UreJ family protein n=1 Tax=Neobacillus niacini TaxID=86668 RepID=UPI002FFFE118